MVKKSLYICLFIFFSACSSNNESVIDTKKSKPGLFSKDASEGVKISDLFGPKADIYNTNVNGYLWRASLEVLSVAPLISTDALGGTIITDWYTNKNIKDKRIKITAYIKTSELRSNGIEVKVHVQNFKNNFWSETYLDKNLATKIEENILNEARNLRIKSTK